MQLNKICSKKFKIRIKEKNKTIVKKKLKLENIHKINSTHITGKSLISKTSYLKSFINQFYKFVGNKKGKEKKRKETPKEMF